MKNYIYSFIILLGLAACGSSSHTQKLKVQEFYAKFEEAKNPILLDVRTAEEYNAEHIDGAINIDFNKDHFKSELSKLDKTKPVFVYCKSGGRSAKSFMVLKELGFDPIYELRGGINSWKAHEKPVVKGLPVKSAPATNVDFKTALAGDKLVMVDFTAVWCGPCQKMKPSIHKLRDEMYEEIVITEVDVDRRKDLASTYRIAAMPTLVFFLNGKEVSRSVGYLTEPQLRNLIKDQLDNL